MVRTVGEPLAAVPVLERLLRRYLDGEYTAISAAAMAQVVSALLYFVSPWDLYPDSVPGKGYADDARCAGLLLEALPAGTGGLSCLGERTAGLPERIGWGVKIRTGGDFPMKRKTLIRQRPWLSQRRCSSPAVQPVHRRRIRRAPAAPRTVWQNRKRLRPPGQRRQRWQYRWKMLRPSFPCRKNAPTSMRKTAAMASGAADGSVLVPAEYAFGYDFDDNGLGQLRKDVGEEITWYKVGLDGTLLGDVNDTVVQTGAGPVVVVEKWNDDSSEGVFQLMNLNLEPLLPEWAEYLYHTNYYAGQKNRFFLRMPGGKLVEFLPEEMALLEFEPYDESRAELYQASWDLAEEEIVVVNGQALFGADAHSWETEDLPLPALEQVDWTIRTEDGLRQTRLSMGQNPDYDIVSFYAEGQGEPTDQIHGENWIAVPGTVTDWPENEPAADPAALLELTGDYCADRGIDPDCMEVTEAVQGEFGVVLALNGGYKRTQEEASEDSWPMRRAVVPGTRRIPAGIRCSTSLNRRASAPLCLEDMALWAYSPGKGRRSG